MKTREEEYLKSKFIDERITIKSTIPGVCVSTFKLTDLLKEYASQQPPKEQTKTFNKLLTEELNKLPFTKGVDDGQYNDGMLDGFELGARWCDSSTPTPALPDEGEKKINLTEVSKEERMKNRPNNLDYIK